MADDKGTPNPNPDDAGKVAKTDFDKVNQELTNLKAEHEDLKNTLFSDDYLDYIEKKEKGGGEPPKKEATPEGELFGLKTEQIEKMSKAELLKFAHTKLKEDIGGDLKKKDDEAASREREESRREIAAFARLHPDDFPKYRPIMHSLSIDPKNGDLTLEELYVKAKEYVKGFGTSDEEKEKQRKLKGEKPGGDNSSYEKYKKMSPDEIAKEAMDEVRSTLGPIPSA